MLITRCPDCDTSFRITVEQLHKADGQVRCGQCAAVFSAFDSLTETTSELEARAAGATADAAAEAGRDAEGDAAQPAAAESDVGIETGGDSDEAGPSPAALASEAFALAAFAPDADAPETPADAAGQPGTTAADISTPATTAEVDAQAISDSEVDQVLEVSRNELIPPWLPEHLAAPAQREPRAWGIAAVCALLALAAQATHHFRGALVQQPYVGPALGELYAKLGVPIEPLWDPQAFTIEARLATAQTSPDTESSLEISAGIRNTTRAPLPYPIIRLQLTDRWEQSLGARMFEASEYLPGSASRRARLRPGTTADVTLHLVDPGPDAYGFQVDVCVPAGAGRVRCRADAVFD